MVWGKFVLGAFMSPCPHGNLLRCDVLLWTCDILLSSCDVFLSRYRVPKGYDMVWFWEHSTSRYLIYESYPITFTGLIPHPLLSVCGEGIIAHKVDNTSFENGASLWRRLWSGSRHHQYSISWLWALNVIEQSNVSLSNSILEFVWTRNKV